MFFIVTYDIADDRRRKKLSDVLSDFGDRVQYSVFECLMGMEELNRMTDRIAAVIDAEQDGVRIYALCTGCENKVTVIGTGSRTQDPDVYIL